MMQKSRSPFRSPRLDPKGSRVELSYQPFKKLWLRPKL
jgi:hypothetical protein